MRKALYHGLEWTTDDAAPGRTRARSRCSPGGYEVDWRAEGAVTAWSILPAREKGAPAPRVRVGLFKDADLAVLACEWHDFRHARSAGEQDGVELSFVGSDSIARLAADLTAEAGREGDEEAFGLIDLLVEDHVCPNGRPFRRAASYFEGRKASLKQNSDASGSYALTFSVSARDLPLWLAEAPVGTKAVLGAVALAGPDELDAAARRAAEAFTRSHVLPADPCFQEWLAARYDRWGLLSSAVQNDSDAVAAATLETVKRLLGIARRRDLHLDRDAVDRLHRLDAEYYKDMSRGHGIRPPADLP